MSVVLDDNEQKNIEIQEIEHNRYESPYSLKRHITHYEFVRTTQTENKIDPNKWFGLFRGYIRQDYYEDELRASWGELFYDLIFVACIVHLAYEGVHSLPTHEEPTHRRLETATTHTESTHCSTEYDYLILVFAEFGLFTTFWLEKVMYITHFLFNQCMDEFLRVMYMAMILSMGIFVSNDEAFHKAFIASYAILRFFSLFMYLKTLLIPKAKCHAFWHLSIYFTIFIALLIIYICMEYQWIHSNCPQTYLLIYFSFFTVEYFGRGFRLILPKTILPNNMRISMNIPHVAERYGLFVMIILGESLISTMTAQLFGELNFDETLTASLHGAPSDAMQIMFIVATFFLSYMIGRLYYLCQPGEENIIENAENHALGRRNKIYGRLYQMAHQVLFFGLFGYGVGIKIAASHLMDSERRWIDVLVPGYSLVVVVMCLNIIRISHPFSSVWLKRVWIQRGIIIGIMVVIPLGAIEVNQGLLFAAMFVCIIMLIVIDVEGHHMTQQSKMELKEKRSMIGDHKYSVVHVDKNDDSSSEHN